MKKLPLLFLMSIILARCVTTTNDVSPRQSYRPNGSKELWDISGSMNSEYNQITGAIQRVLNVYINEEPVIHGTLSPMATGELSGKYKNHKVNSICASEMKTQTWMDVRCTILIDNERAATLTF